MCVSLSSKNPVWTNFLCATTTLTTPSLWLSHHSLHNYIDNECDLLPCITLAIQPQSVLVNSIKVLWLQWGSWAVQYPCFSAAPLSHRDAPAAGMRRHICLAVEEALERRSRRRGGAEGWVMMGWTGERWWEGRAGKKMERGWNEEENVVHLCFKMFCEHSDIYKR